jgi:hypothetical protein
MALRSERHRLSREPHFVISSLFQAAVSKALMLVVACCLSRLSAIELFPFWKGAHMQNQNNRVLSRIGARVLTEKEQEKVTGAYATLPSTGTGGIHGMPSDNDGDL